MGRGLLEGVAFLEPRHHHLDGDHRVVDEQPERDDQRAERDALHRDAGVLHDDEGDRQHQRDGQRDDEAGAHAEADEADHQHDGDRLEERAGEVADRLLDHHRLVGHEVHADADRQVADDAVHLGVQRLAELEQVGAGLHADRQADRRLAPVAEQRRRRVGVAAGDGGDVAEPEEAVVDPEVDAAQALLGAELAADAQADRARGRPASRPRARWRSAPAASRSPPAGRCRGRRAGGWRIRGRSPRPGRRSARPGRRSARSAPWRAPLST